MNMMLQQDDTRTSPKILLINPPFDWTTGTYISIPVLAAYLQNRNIAVTAFDLKREFYVRLLTPQNILRGITYAKKRFVELNNEPLLNFSQIVEYRILVTLLSELRTFRKDIEILRYPFAAFSDIQNSAAIDFFILAATLPYFPEIIMRDFTTITATLSACSLYNPYSSTDILESCTQHNYYTRLFENIIDETILPNHHPRIIGFSLVVRSQIIPAFQCADLIKKRLPHVHITMGGPCISIHFCDLREKRLFDIVDSFILQEGEISLETLVNELYAPQPDLSKVPGLVYLDKNSIHFNEPPPALDLENSFPPDYNVFQLESYLHSKESLLTPVRLSKGCHWQKCAFCRTTLPMYRNYQQLSMEAAYEHIQHVVKTTGLSFFLFSDETASPEILEYISKRLLADQINIQWIAQTRISRHLTKARCELYREAGCMRLMLGIESLSNRILELIKKGITVEQIETVLGNIDGKLPLTAYMIIGFPTETEKEAQEGYKKLTSFLSQGLIDHYTYAVLSIDSGSDISHSPKKYGISELFVPEGSDLSPDILRFTSSGMSREKAHQLAKQFNVAMNSIWGQKPPEESFSKNELRIDGHVIRGRYNFQEIEDLITSKSFTDMPFIRWLHANKNLSCYPFKAGIQ